MSIHPTCSYMRSIQDGDIILEEANSDFLTSSSITEWLLKSPRAKATLTMFDDDTSIELPVYTLRRRNAIVADLPDAPLFYRQNMKRIEDFQTVINKQLENNDDIEDIRFSLSTVYDVNISPVFCSSLLLPIIQHAIHNNQLEDHLNTYIDILSDLYKYILTEKQIQANRYFSTCVSLLADVLKALKKEDIDDCKYEFQLKELYKIELLNILYITTESCNRMMSINRNELESNLSLHLLWNYLPKLLNHCTNDLITPIIKSATSIIQHLIHLEITELYDLQVENLIYSLLQLYQKNQHNDIAFTLCLIIEKYPTINIKHRSSLSTITNIIASTAQQENQIMIKALLNVSCLLLRNYTKTPWLHDILVMVQCNSIEILKEKSRLLLNFTRDIDDSSTIEFMDIDSSQSIDSIFDCTFIFNELKKKVDIIIEQLTTNTIDTNECLILLNQLKEISIHTDNTNIMTLCQNHIKTLTEFVVRLLVLDPDLTETVTLTLGYEKPQFISTFIEYALPYSIFSTQDGDTLWNISNTLNMTTNQLFDKYGHYIVIDLLFQTDTEKRTFSLNRLQQVSGEIKIYKKLTTSNATKITTRLCLNLGNPLLQKQSLLALHEMKKMIYSNTPMTIAQYISNYFLYVLTQVSKFISEKRNSSVFIHEPFALEALKELMILLGSDINDHSLHLIKVFQTVNELNDFQLQALSLWEIFISVLDEEGFQSNFNGILYGLFQILPLSTRNIRKSIAKVIEQVLDRYIQLNSITHFSDLPTLPSYKELQPLYRSYKSKLSSDHLQIQIRKIIKNLDNPDNVQIVFELKKLEIILDQHFTSFDIGRLISKLLSLVKKHASNKEITKLIGICFGKIGAVDPNSINIKSIHHHVFIMNNFLDTTENLNFICQLIINHIFPAYGAIRNEEVYPFFHLSVQSLLRSAGFSNPDLLKKKSSPVYMYWQSLPPSVKEFLLPFLNSTFTRSRGIESIEYPIFPSAISFQDWIQKWYFRMTLETNGKAKEIFEACIPIVISNVVDVTTFLLPYLVVYLILSGNGDSAIRIIDEMLLVLTTNTEYNLTRADMNQQCLQVVVSITEYCRKWLNNVKLGERKLESLAKRIVNFLSRIPDNIMAIAAFHTKAYPQALMHFETYYKNRLDELSDETLNYLRQIYTHLEYNVDLIALLKEYKEQLEYDDDLILFETTGQWSYGETLLLDRVEENPKDYSLYTECMDHLKKWDHYDTVLDISEKAIISIPEWSTEINSNRIDSAWRLNDYRSLDTFVSLPMKRTPGALIGCILSKMKNEKNIEAANLIETLRDNLVDKLLFHTSDSYRKSYLTIFNLQLLQELETSQEAWESKNPIESISKLQGYWNFNYKNIASNYQYKNTLLELRKAAFFDIRAKPNTEMYEANLWLKLAKSSRKVGDLSYALNALLNAEKVDKLTCSTERAKWYWAAGYKEKAFEFLSSCLESSDVNLVSNVVLLAKFHVQDSSYLDEMTIKNFFAKSLKERSEKLHYTTMIYYNNMAAKKELRHPNPKFSPSLTHYVLKASMKALSFGSKYFYSTMSTFINKWFEFVTIAALEKNNLGSSIQAWYEKVNEMLNEVSTHIRPYQFSLFLTRLISHLSVNDTIAAGFLQKIILSVFLTYPSSTIWLLLDVEDSKDSILKDRVKQILDKAQTNPNIKLVIQHAGQLKEALRQLAMLKPQIKNTAPFNMRDFPELRNLCLLKQLKIYIPTETSLYPKLPQHVSKSSETQVFPSNLPFVERIHPEFIVMRSLQQPKRITILGSDGKQYKFLVKTEDDLRKDARTMEFNYAINSFLEKDSESRNNKLYIRTYAVIPLGGRWGLIQWLDSITPLKTIVNEIWVSEGRRSVAQISASFKELQDRLDREVNREFKNAILPQCPVVFYRWFLKKFPEPNQWLASRTRYIKTLAVMSIVGYMVGLGDRHAENILFDETNGDCVHVDLNMLFGVGIDLTVPEVVPFRLTPNLVDAMGILGYRGLFTTTCKTTMTVLLKNKDALISVFQTLGHVWALTDKEISRSLTLMQKGDMGRKIQFEEKFKIELGPKADKEVEELIESAANLNNLAKMFAGWAPFV